MRSLIFSISSLLLSFVASSTAYDTIPGSSCLRSYSGMMESMNDLAQKYPDLMSIEDIGDSYLKNNEGRVDGNYIIPEGGYDIYAFVVTAGHRANKGKMLLTSGVHSRELAPPELLARYIEMLVYGYDEDADITWVLDHNEIHAVLYLNPDGRYMAENYPELLWRKNLNPNGGCQRSDSYGTDLNRNFDFMWSYRDGSSHDPCENDYHGRSPESEPESQALAEYARRIFPQGQRKSNPEGQKDEPFGEGNTGMYVDIHASGGYVYYPWGHEDSISPDDEALQALGRKMNYFNDYKLWAGGQEDFLYAASGDISDWMYAVMGVASMGLEIGDEWVPNCNEFENSVVPDNLRALLYAAKTSSSPFKDIKGPDVLNLSVKQTNGHIGLSAIASDSEMLNQIQGFPDFRTGDQNINSVKVYLDVHPDDYTSSDTMWTMQPTARRLELEDFSSATDKSKTCKSFPTKKKCKRAGGGDMCAWKISTKKCISAGNGSGVPSVSEQSGSNDCESFSRRSKCKKAFGGDICSWSSKDKMCTRITSNSTGNTGENNSGNDLFDSDEEDVELTIDAGSLTPGRHAMFVQATDSDGYEGPVTSVFLQGPSGRRRRRERRTRRPAGH